MANLRAAHAADGGSRMGVDVVRGEAGDMSQLGIYEAFRVKSQVRFACGFCMFSAACFPAEAHTHVCMSGLGGYDACCVKSCMLGAGRYTCRTVSVTAALRTAAHLAPSTSRRVRVSLFVR